jgi:hypothetical protein
MSFFENVCSWFLRIWQKILCIFKNDEANPTPTISTEQADWLAICLMGSFDLLCARDYAGGPVLPGENDWIAAEVNTIAGKAGALKPSCSAAMQTVLGTFIGYMPNFPGYRGNWQAFLLSETAINGVSFGAWLRSQDVTKIVWAFTDSSNPAPYMLDLGFYTAILFADLGAFFIGVCGNLESYWNANMPRYSGQLIVAHYYAQAAGIDVSIRPPYSPLTGSQLAAYTLSLQCMADIMDVSKFAFGPYTGYGTSMGFANFSTEMAGYSTNLLNPPAWPLINPYLQQSTAFSVFAKQNATASSWNGQSGLNDMGNYFDGAAYICRQLLSMNALIPAVFASTNYPADYANLAPYFVVGTPIPKTTTGGDSMATIMTQSSTTNIDGTSPYAGFFASQCANPGGGGGNANMDACLSAISVSPNLTRFTFYIIDTTLIFLENPTDNPTFVYYNSIVDNTPNAPFNFSTGPKCQNSLSSFPNNGDYTNGGIAPTECDSNGNAGQSSGSALLASAVSLYSVGLPPSKNK